MGRVLFPQNVADAMQGGWLFLLCVLMLLPLVTSTAAMGAETAEQARAIPVPNPSADLWREVRQRDGVVVGKTQVAGVDSGALINLMEKPGVISACSN